MRKRGRKSMKGMEGPRSRGWVASKGNSNTPEDTQKPREGGTTLQISGLLSSEKLGTGSFRKIGETTGTPPPPPPPVLGLLSCALLQTFLHTCTYTSTYSQSGSGSLFPFPYLQMCVQLHWPPNCSIQSRGYFEICERGLSCSF